MIGLSADGLAIALAAGASATTFLGGRIALLFGARLPLLMGVTAGAVMGVALFELLPEAFALGHVRWPAQALLGAFAAGFIAYMMAGRLIDAHLPSGARLRPHVAPAVLTLHSFMDGAGIGLGFQVSTGVGLLVAAAVLAHDIADGINTVGLGLAGGSDKLARRWLWANSAAPMAGVLIGARSQVGPATMSLLLAAMAGIFLYIATGEVMPRSHTTGDRMLTTWATCCAILFTYSIVRLAQI